MANHLEFTCPKCGKLGSAGAEHIGSVVACYYCGGHVRLARQKGALPPQSPVDFKPVEFPPDGRVLVKWRDREEAVKVYDHLMFIKEQTVIRIYAARERLRQLEASHRAAMRATGPSLWWIGGAIGNALHLTQFAAKTTAGVLYSQQMHAIEAELHILNTRLFNIEDVASQMRHAFNWKK